ncbi:MAG: TIGR00304 family protein [Candidatus Methanoperedens sp.]|nr:TIGR00304 family protein [Candidatus Methanoperedens sp.]MCZ7371902.1 TIGR00304 family protein [Candidatus Methanoperedens sp.]
MPDWTYLISIGIALILLGFLFVAYGIMRSSRESAGTEGRISDQGFKEERVKGGGVILIGPIPIVFGSDRRYVIIAMILAIVLVALVIMK